MALVQMQDELRTTLYRGIDDVDGKFRVLLDAKAGTDAATELGARLERQAQALDARKADAVAIDAARNEMLAALRMHNKTVAKPPDSQTCVCRRGRVASIATPMKRLIYGIALILTITGVFARSAFAQAANPYLGEIQIFSFNFCPTGWLPLNGQLLQISQNEALFNLIGTTYGGDGVSTFAVPKWGRIFTANGQSMLPCMAILGVYPSQN